MGIAQRGTFVYRAKLVFIKKRLGRVLYPFDKQIERVGREDVMNETSKLNDARLKNGYNEYFSGDGIDIGCGSDVLSKDIFKNITSVMPYDLHEGDALTCHNLDSNRFDFVYSSHCLEHMDDPYKAMENWIRICVENGYIVVAVPHEIYYEKNVWPSQYNNGHKHSFRIESKSSMPKSIHVFEMLNRFENISIVKLGAVLKFDLSRFWEDQTLNEGICQIEFVIRKNG